MRVLDLSPLSFLYVGPDLFCNRQFVIEVGFKYLPEAEPGSIAWRWHWEWHPRWPVEFIRGIDTGFSTRWTGRTCPIIGIAWGYGLNRRCKIYGVASRARDVILNDMWASGATTRILENTIGATPRTALE